MSESQAIATQIKALTIFDANNKMMSVSECANYLGVHSNTVKNRIHNETINAIFQEGKYHIPRLQFVKRLISDFLNNSNENLVNDEDLFKSKLDTYFNDKFSTKN